MPNEKDIIFLQQVYHTEALKGHRKKKKVVRIPISFPRNNISLPRNNISFPQNSISFPQNNISFPQNNISFE